MTLKIIKIENNNYTLVNSDNKSYKLNLKFFGLQTPLNIGDTIKIHEKLLDKNFVEYNASYIFGPLDSLYGRTVKSKEDIEVIAVKTNNNIIYLKRFFG